MNLDELRSVQSKERAKDSLQHLRESFYADVATYVQGLRDERERIAAEVANPFDSAEINRLSDEIATAEEVVEALYERRVGKVVKRASLSAAGMNVDEEGLTSEEQELYADLVDRIQTNKSRVLDVLGGEIPAAGSTSVSERASDPADASDSSASAAGGVSAADVMGGSPDPTSPDTASPSPSESGSSADSDAVDEAREPADEARESVDEARESADESPTADPGPAESAPTAETATDEAADVPSDLGGADDVDRTTVRITQDVGEIFGVDEREYTLSQEDVVTLPAANAEPLLERDAAERLD